MTSATPGESRAPSASVVVLGADAVLAASPATAVQLTHACLLAGYHTVVPASWGDELLAAETLRRLRERGDEPAIYCACPRAAARLTGVGSDLAPFLVALVSPPVATARYLRAVAGDTPIRITYVGKCPSVSDQAIDAHFTPAEFLATLADRGISLKEQPVVFDALLSPDRRRFRSLPGGLPTPELLWTDGGGRTLVQLDGEDPTMPAQLAQHLFADDHVLIDIAPTLGCVCTGAVAAVPARGARAAVSASEPPRAASPVVEDDVRVALSVPLAPPAPRTPRELPVEAPVRTVAGENGGAHEEVDRTPADAPPAESAPLRRRMPRPVRAAPSTVPSAAMGEGRPLPRAYIARRSSARRAARTADAPGVPDGAGREETGTREAAATTGAAAIDETRPAPTAGVASGKPVAPTGSAGLAASSGDAASVAPSGDAAPTPVAAAPPGPERTVEQRPRPGRPPRGAFAPLARPIEERRRDRVLILAIVALVSAAIGIAAGASLRSFAHAGRVDASVDSLRGATIEPSGDTARTESAAGVAALRDSTVHDTTAGDGAIGIIDSVAPAIQATDSAVATPSDALRSAPARARPRPASRAPPARRRAPAVQRTTVTSAASTAVADSGRGPPVPGETASDSAQLIRRELEARRARLDSLARIVDSLDSARARARRRP